MLAEKINTQALCKLRLIRKGRLLVSAATLAPIVQCHQNKGQGAAY